MTRPLFSAPVNSVTVPGTDGELTLLPNHIPLVTPLKAGEIIIRQGDKETYVAISSGFLTVEPTRITILADAADLLEELDEKKIEEAKAKAEKLLTEKQFADDRSFADAAAMLERSIAQLKIVRKRRHK